MTMENIFKTMQDLIAEQFAMEADEITMESSFADDLGADSVDLVELVMAMEEEFGLEIKAEEAGKRPRPSCAGFPFSAVERSNHENFGGKAGL